MQQKLKLEEDLNDLELSLDMANKNNVDAQKQLKKLQCQTQVKYNKQILNFQNKKNIF